MRRDRDAVKYSNSLSSLAELSAKTLENVRCVPVPVLGISHRNNFFEPVVEFSAVSVDRSVNDHET
jgi:hypothetical protein